MTKKDEALAAIDAADVRAGQCWVHAKTGRPYTIQVTGLAESTLSPVVVYVGSDGVTWVRSLEMFIGRTDSGEPRFVRARESESARGFAAIAALACEVAS